MILRFLIEADLSPSHDRVRILSLTVKLRRSIRSLGPLYSRNNLALKMTSASSPTITMNFGPLPAGSFNLENEQICKGRTYDQLKFVQ